MVDGLPSLLYSSLPHYHLFCLSRICILFLFSSRSLLNLLTLFLISYVFSRISNLPSLSPSHFLSSIYYSFSFLLATHPSPLKAHVPPQIFHHHALSLSQSYVSPSHRPSLPTLDPPPSSFLPSNGTLSLAHDPTSPPPPLTDLFSRFIPFEYTRTDRRSPSRRWSRCLSPTPCSASQSGCLPRALLTATLVREKILPDASRVTTTVSSTIVARDTTAIVAVFLPRETAEE